VVIYHWYILVNKRPHYFSSHICVFKGNPFTCRTLTGVQTVLPRRPDGCTWTLDSFGTLKSIHDVRTDATLNCSKLLDTDGSSDDIATSSGWMLRDECQILYIWTPWFTLVRPLALLFSDVFVSFCVLVFYRLIREEWKNFMWKYLEIWKSWKVDRSKFCPKSIDRNFP